MYIKPFSDEGGELRKRRQEQAEAGGVRDTEKEGGGVEGKGKGGTVEEV